MRSAALLLHILLFIVLFDARAFANDAFHGLWGSVGMKVTAPGSTRSLVDYDYDDLHAGGSAAPGFRIQSTYDSANSKPAFIPALEFTYLYQLKKTMYLGLAISMAQPTLELSNPLLSIPNPYGQPGHLDEMQMRTISTASYDAAVTLELASAFSKKWMAYGGIGIHSMSSVLRTKTSVMGGLTLPEWTETTSIENFGGMELRAGLRFLATDTFYLQLGYEIVSFQEKVIAAPTIMSWPDEMTMTQNQKLLLGWQAFSFVAAVGF